MRKDNLTYTGPEKAGSVSMYDLLQPIIECADKPYPGDSLWFKAGEVILLSKVLKDNPQLADELKKLEVYNAVNKKP